MGEEFAMGRDTWRVLPVAPEDPVLLDGYGERTLAVTDVGERCVYVSAALTVPMLSRVLAHEVCHCAIATYGLDVDMIGVLDQGQWREVEEWACNLVADHGREILDASESIGGGRHAA